MANTIQSSQIYNHFLTAYAPKEVTRADTHKKDELRGIYNSIVKLSKESPLYLLTNDSAMEADAVGIKESARNLQGTLAGLETDTDDALFSRKSAYTSDDTMVDAAYIGGDRPLDEVPSFQIQIDKLATQQRNVGNYLPQEPAGLEQGGYSFHVRVADLSYEFQYSVRPGDTNQDIQERLGRLINRSNIGLSAEILTDAEGQTALTVTSDEFGLPAGKTSRFSFEEPPSEGKLDGTVDYFGLNHTEVAADNARFILNGNEHSSVSNHFTVASMYELHLLRERGEGDEGSVSVGVKDDSASLIDRARDLVGGYNRFLDSIGSFQNKHFKGTKVTNEVTSIAKRFNGALETLGLSIAKDGRIAMDEGQISASATQRTAKQDFQPLKEFADALKGKMRQIALDPMHYIERPVVAYKNPGHEFPNPYVTSEYSGMMFNSYC